MSKMVQLPFDSKNRYRRCLIDLKKGFVRCHLKSLKKLGKARKDGQNNIPQIPAAANISG